MPISFYTKEKESHMFMWLLVLLLLFGLIYIVYRMNLSSTSNEEMHETQEHYTFKL
jgi:type VI protein secretion system component VasF